MWSSRQCRDLLAQLLKLLGQRVGLDRPQRRGRDVGQTIADAAIDLSASHLRCRGGQQGDDVDHAAERHVGAGRQPCCRPAPRPASSPAGRLSLLLTLGIVRETEPPTSAGAGPATGAVGAREFTAVAGTIHHKHPHPHLLASGLRAHPRPPHHVLDLGGGRFVGADAPLLHAAHGAKHLTRPPIIAKSA